MWVLRKVIKRKHIVKNYLYNYLIIVIKVIRDYFLQTLSLLPEVNSNIMAIADTHYLLFFHLSTP